MPERIQQQVIDPVTRLSDAPDALSTTTSELLLGESVQLLERAGDWSRVRAALDDYEGWTLTAALSDAVQPATHRVAVRATLRFAARGIKCVPAVRLPHGARVCVKEPAVADDEGLIALADGGWVHATHLQPVHRVDASTMAALALSLYGGAPYLWGGRTPDGCDCSGLVQSVARATGVPLPRDSGPQESAIATVVAPPDRQANDLVFWPGHVAILIDARTVVHANAHTLSVAVEPLADLVRRAGEPSSTRRLA